MTILERYTKLRKHISDTNTGDKTLSYLDDIIKVVTPIKGKDYVDGKDGYTPIKDKDYRDGIDAYTPRKGIDYFDGYTPVKNKDYFDGERGEKGADGYSPIKNKDYFDGAKGEKGKDGYTPIKNKDYFDGKAGKSGATITAQQIRNKLEDLEGDARLDASAIKNIGKYASSTTMSMGGSSESGGGAWGDITGTLSSQTDLQTALDTKLLIDRSNMPNGTITRTAGLISSIAYVGGRTLTITRTSGYISSMTDTVHTWTLTRNASNQITAYAIT